MSQIDQVWLIGRLSQDLIAECSDGVIVIDAQLRYILWNPAMERLSGVSADAVLGKFFLDAFPFLKDTGEDQLILRSLQGTKIVSEGRPFSTPAGKRGYFDGIYTPLHGDDGKIIATLCLVKDATKRALVAEFMEPIEQSDILDELSARPHEKLARALGEAIHDRRKILGLSQEELAYQANLHRTYVSDVERGARSISVATLEKFAKALRIRGWVLLGIAESRFSESKLLERLWV